MMDKKAFRSDVTEAIWRASDNCPFISSITLTGSFAEADSEINFSDIDLIVVASQIDALVQKSIVETFQHELTPVVESHGRRLFINTFFGPLKFDAPDLAVLHLMIYDSVSHRNHVAESPFTCFDWQRSRYFRKRRLESIFPIFGLQPGHFLGARRGLSDYLSDLRSGSLTYRSVIYEGFERIESRRWKRMEDRDKYEFAFHVMRFLMLNLLKLVSRNNSVFEDRALVARYSEVFPLSMDDFSPLYFNLLSKKRGGGSSFSESELLPRLEHFLECFERQFVFEFEVDACRQLWIRHAPTMRNRSGSTFQGAIDEDISEHDPDSEAHFRMVAKMLSQQNIVSAVTSPRRRAISTARRISLLCERPVSTEIDQSLDEIDYGLCDGEDIESSLSRFPSLRAGWSSGQDPRFPSGENSADVRTRLNSFLSRQSDRKLVVTHNVVMKELLGEALNIPFALRYRLIIPHVTPVTVIQSRRFGLYVDLEPETFSLIFANFFSA
jgi:broad specificity phosphatase PhoE